MNDQSPASLRKARYVMAWTEALAGGPIPDAQSFLEGLPNQERRQLELELRALEPFCRELCAKHGRSRQETTGDTVDVSATAELQSKAMPATGEFASTPVGQTTDFRVTPLPRASDKTAKESQVPGNTIAAAQAGSGQDTGAFELNVPSASTVTTPKDKRPRGKLPTVPGYEILGVLGRGGMGVVYKAKQTGLDRLVALKMILAGEHASQVHLDRFQAEAQAVAKLRHPYVVQVFDVGQHDGLPFFSLEYVDGGCLADKIQHKPQPPRICAQIVEALARAMQSAHQHGIVHRDLKPANVLLQNLEEDASSIASLHDRSFTHVKGTPGDVWEKAVIPKITDFGLAKRLEGDSGQTRSGTILGTPSYMAPEQARGDTRDVGPLADVYALGAILYEMLTGRPPFLAATPMETVMAVLKEEPVQPRQLQPSIPRDLETICLKCLQKEQGKRFKSAGELADDLRRFLTGEAIHARPVSRPERFWRWCKRNPRFTMMAATILGLVLMGITTLIAFSMQLNQQKQTAERERDVANGQTELAVEAYVFAVREAQHKLGRVPGARQVRQDLLKMAMENLQKVEKSRTREQGKADRSMAAAYLLMGELLWDNPQTRAQAVEYFKRCYAAVAELHQENPNDKAAKNLGVALTRMSKVSQYVDNDPAKARQQLTEALSYLNPLADKTTLSDNLTRNEVIATIADVELGLGRVEIDQQNPAAARPHTERCLQLASARLAKDEKDPELQGFAGGAYLSMADVQRRLNEQAGYESNLQKGLELLQAAYAADPDNANNWGGLRKSLADSGDSFVFKKDGARAEPLYKLNLDVTRQMAEVDESLPVQRDLAMAYYRLGAAHSLQGRAKEAQENFQQCLAIRERHAKEIADRSSKQSHMVTLGRAGEYDRMEQIVTELRQAYETDPKVMREIAAAYGAALATLKMGKKTEELATDDRVRANDFVKKAMAALNQASAGPKVDLVHLDTEPDLFSLHDTPEYQAWKAGIEARQKANP